MKAAPSSKDIALASDELPLVEDLNLLCGEDWVLETPATYDSASGNRRGFKELVVYRASIELTGLVYQSSKSFPKEELFGLTRQVREASVSVSLNIAEGWGRNRKTEFARACEIARGSAHEVDAAFDVAMYLGYAQKQELMELHSKLNRVSGMLLRLIESLRSGSKQHS